MMGMKTQEMGVARKGYLKKAGGAQMMSCSEVAAQGSSTQSVEME
jgi:hypothetical protein